VRFQVRQMPMFTWRNLVILYVNQDGNASYTCTVYCEIVYYVNFNIIAIILIITIVYTYISLFYS